MVDADGTMTIEAKPDGLSGLEGRFAQSGCLGKGPLMEQWIPSPADRRWRLTLPAAV
jgi:hypothetical protein